MQTPRKELLNKIKHLASVLADASAYCLKKKSVGGQDDKNNYNISKVCLGKMTRMLTWIRWWLEGKSLEDQLRMDKNFLYWMKHTEANYILKDVTEFINNKYNIDLFELMREWYIIKYKISNKYPFNYYHMADGEWISFSNQDMLWDIILMYLFPPEEESRGLFSMFRDDDSIEKTVLKENVEGLLKDDYEKLKEIKSFYII